MWASVSDRDVSINFIGLGFSTEGRKSYISISEISPIGKLV